MTPAEHARAADRLIEAASELTVGSPNQIGLSLLATAHATRALYRAPVARKRTTKREDTE